MNDKTRMLLDELDGVEEKSGYWTALCPAHGDTTNSLSVRDGDNGGTVVKCHTGCSAAEVVQAVGFTLSQICPELNGSRSGKSKSGKLGTLVASYQYVDADDVLRYEACRFEKTVDGQRQKTFTQRKPNGKGGWIYKMTGVERIPYRLPGLVNGDSTEPILIVEGEKHCDKLAELGFIATCNVGGAGKWLASYNQYLKGRDVVILPDNDDVGRKHAKKVFKSLSGHVKSIHILTLNVENEKDDVLDWFDQGNTGEELRILVENAVAFGSDLPEEDEVEEVDHNSTDVDKEIIKALDIDVLGITDKGFIKVFSNYHKRVEEIRDVDRLTMVKLLAICGPSVRYRIYEGQEDTPSGYFKLKAVKQAISVLAGFRVLDEDSELGVGVWRRMDDDGVEKWVLVGSGESAVLNGELESHAKPRFGDSVLALTNNEPWYSFDDLLAVTEVYSSEFAKQVAGQLESWFDCWKFEHQNESPALLTGLVMASWVQTAWRWRPQVALSGQSASGKSSLFNFLTDGHGGGIFGRLAIKSSGPTAAGLRQAIGTTSQIALCDEMEDSRDRPKFIEMLRSSGSGDQIIRGSSSHAAQSFGLQHIVWMGSTETGLEREADLNRFIKINLLKPTAEESGGLPDVNPSDLRMFGVKLLVTSMKCFERANEIVSYILKSKPTNHDIRVVQSYAVAASMYSAAMGFGNDEAVDTFIAMISVMDGGGEIESLQDDLLETIKSSLIKVDKEDESVSAAILRGPSNHTSSIALANAGIRIVDDKLFIAHKIAKRMLLQRTEYEKKNIREILLRLPGAEDTRQRINGDPKRGVLIPMPDLKVSDEEAEELLGLF